jgi:glucose/arabinose dehydrogenase
LLYYNNKALIRLRMAFVINRYYQFSTAAAIIFLFFMLPDFLQGQSFHSAYAASGSFVDSRIAGDLKIPTSMAFAPDGRLFVTEKEGALKVIKNGDLLSTPFLSVSVDDRGERGLGGIVFDPDFATNGYVYVYYTTNDFPIHNRLSRFTADPAHPDRAMAGSEVQILNLDTLDPESFDHNGGAMHFGKDGRLYLGVGDNGHGSNSQSLSTLLGKMLRINSDGSIPSDNPFFNVTGSRKEIWALGLRNPFTSAFSPAADATKMNINDVGEYTWEEIDPGIRGANYGHPICEGPCSNPGFVNASANKLVTITSPANKPGNYNITLVSKDSGTPLQNPIYAYNHNGKGASITGGAFYESSQFPPEYKGSYFFGDHTVGFIKRLTPTNKVVDFLPSVKSPVDIDIGSDGSLYYLSGGWEGGDIHKVQFISGGNHFPHAVATAIPSSGQLPLAVNFDGTMSTDSDAGQVLFYSWKFGDDSQAATNAKVEHIYKAAGPYIATLTVNDGHGGMDSAPVNITVGNTPVGTIIKPMTGAKYNAGDTISLSASGTDSEDGVLPNSAFKWLILFYHNSHTDPLLEFNGANRSFTIPTSGETSSNVWYRIYLTVTDSTGLSKAYTRDVIPNKSNITLTSNIPGLQISLDGQPLTTPASVVGVVEMNRTIQSAHSQLFGGKTYVFKSWSDGGSATHTITTPAEDTTYTATSTVTCCTTTHMSDTTASAADPLFGIKQIESEFVTGKSVLVGKQIDSITVKLGKKGAPTGTAQIGVFNADLSVKKLFGIKDASTLTTTFTDFTFLLTNNELYQIQSGDYIGVKFTGYGSSTHNVLVMRDWDGAEPFDGTNTYKAWYNGVWNTVTGDDLYMVLKQTHG